MLTGFENMWFEIIMIFAASVAIIVTIEHEERFWLPAGIIMATIAVGVIFRDFGKAFLNLEFLDILRYVVLYFLVGSFWGLFKWWTCAKRYREKYEDCKLEWLSNKGFFGNEVPEELKEAWAEHLMDKPEYSRTIWTEKTPSERKCIIKIGIDFRDYKERIICWMAYWPWSILGYICNDFFRSIWNFAFRAISSLLDLIGKLALRGVENDYVVKDKYGEKTK